MASSNQKSSSSFPHADSKILPNPSKFFSKKILSSPLPTHSFFQNFVVGNGDHPVFLHPYMVKLSSSALSLSYPSVTSSPSSVSQNFSPDFTISTLESSQHMVSSYSDLTVTVDFEASYLRYILARGCPYITLEISSPISLSFSTNYPIKSLSSSASNTKHRIELENKQIWIIYSSSELILKKREEDLLKATPFVGIIRVTITPNNKPKTEEILDLYKGCYATNEEAVFSDSFSLEYNWETKGWGDLLMLEHPLHLTLLSSIYNSKIRVLSNFKYKSIDGELVGIVGNSWSLRAPNLPITWHFFRGISGNCHPEIVASLWRDVGALDSTEISTNHCLHYGLKISSAAKLALIAQEVNCNDVIPAIKKFLRDTITPWLEAKFEGNGFVYESKWGGIVTKNGVNDRSADYGFGLYNCNHAYLGNFVYASGVLVKLDSDWGEKFRGQVYDLVASYMCLGKKGGKSKCAKFRCFDFYKLCWNNGSKAMFDLSIGYLLPLGSNSHYYYVYCTY